MMYGNGKFRLGTENPPATVYVGYIVIPDDVDRDRYIETCLRKERVDIYVEGGGYIQQCHIDKNVLQNIYFPEKGELGSAIVYVTPQFHNIPIVVGSISKGDESQLLEVNSFKKVVKFQDNTVSIVGKGKTGELFINVESEYEDEGNVFVTLRNKNKSSKFNLKCFGDINIYSEGKTYLKTLSDIDLKVIEVENGEEITVSELLLDSSGFKLVDKEGNEIASDNEGNVNIKPTTKCNLFEGNSPLVKGDELKEQLELLSARLDDLWDTISGAPIVPGDGGASIKTSVIVKKLTYITSGKENFDNINSSKSFTD